jgi:hypothetical protein
MKEYFYPNPNGGPSTARFFLAEDVEKILTPPIITLDEHEKRIKNIEKQIQELSKFYQRVDNVIEMIKESL